MNKNDFENIYCKALNCKALNTTDINDFDIELISDGYHTFKELYEFRMQYNAAFFNMLAQNTSYRVIKSKRHSDGELCFGGGWFIVQAQLPTGQISNHYENKYWHLFKVECVDQADDWDGHTEKDVLERLNKFNLNFEI